MAVRFAPRTAIRKKRAIVRADVAVSVGSGGQPRQRDTMNASDPPRQVALIGKASAGSDFGQPRPPFANKLERTLQSEVHDVAMRRHTDRSGKHPREMEWAAPREIRERLDADRLIKMSDDVIPEPPELVFAQRAARPRWHRRGVARHQSIDEAARRLVPGEGSVWIIVYALVSQGAGEREKRRVITVHALDQPRLGQCAFRGCQRHSAWIDRDDKNLDVLVGIAATITPRRSDRQRPDRTLVTSDATSHALFDATWSQLEADAVTAWR